jgi:Thioredoxin-like/Surface antigen variable number repeat
VLESPSDASIVCKSPGEGDAIMMTVNKRRKVGQCLEALLCLSLLFLVRGTSAQTKPETKANDATDTGFTPVVVEAVTIQSGDEFSAEERSKLGESLKGEAYTEKWLAILTGTVTRRLEDEGFLDAAPKTTVRSLKIVDGKEHVEVSVDVNAGPRYIVSAIWWMGSSVFTPKQLDDLILPRVGDVLRLSALRESDLLLRKAYAERGYPAAAAVVMSQKFAKNGKVTLYIEVFEGKKSSEGESAGEKQPGCTTPTMDEIRKAPFAPRAVSYDPNVDAQVEIERAKLEAERTNREVLLIAGGDWCGWCHVLDQTFERFVPLRQLRDQKFVVVHVNVSEKNGNACALRSYPAATGYPFFYVIDVVGKLMATSDGREWESPYGYDPARIEQFLKNW